MTAQAASVPTHPQLVRVARLLGVEVEQLPVELATVPADDLRTLHDQIGEAIHRGFSGSAAQRWHSQKMAL